MAMARDLDILKLFLL